MRCGQVIVAWSVVINVFGVAFGFVPPTVFSLDQFCGLMRLSMVIGSDCF